MNTEY